jgi:hypothetical protein
LTIISIEGAVKKVEIDLTAKYVLRSDGIDCGSIKKPRRQQVYPAFLIAFSKAYEFHKQFIRGGIEQDYCPMFVNSRRKAMRYSDYKYKFHNLITDYVRPELLQSNDPENRLYGQLLCENNLSPHALRH